MFGILTVSKLHEDENFNIYLCGCFQRLH